MDGKNKISVVLDVPEFARFDSYCAEKGFKKSTLIARLIREHLDHEGYRSEPVEMPSRPSGARRRKQDRARGSR